jgi:hypothetical protein
MSLRRKPPTAKETQDSINLGIVGEKQQPSAS